VKAFGTGLVCVCSTAAQSVPARAPGDPVAGKALFEGRGGCVSCHAVEGRGSKAGPDLSWIGVLRSRDSLRRALIDPAAVAHTKSSATLSAAEVDHLVAYLSGLKAIPPSEPRDRTRAIAPVTESVDFFDRPEREAEEQSEALIDALGIREGARVADLGAGTGYFTWRLARRVGPSGKVIAVDIRQSMLDLAAQAVQAHRLANVDFVLGKENDPRLAERSLDMVFIAHSYHEFAQPEMVLDAVRRSLKRGGRLVIVEYKKESLRAPAAPLHKMSLDEIRTEIEPMGFDLDRILDFLPVQHCLIFIPR
jgi:precorrin-6B methylase 2/mono/diheme cytochrome c family protein